MRLYKSNEQLGCEIIHFADGDTVFCRVDCEHCGLSRKIHVRLKGIESYELIGEHRAKALAIKLQCDQRWGTKKAKLIPTQTSSDKYGRIVGTIFIDDKTLQELLVTEGLAWYI